MLRLKRPGQWNKDTEYLSDTATVYGYSEDTGIHALASVFNSLMAAGAEEIGVGIKIRYPLHTDKRDIYQMEKNIRRMCRDRNLALLDSEIAADPMIPVPEVTITGMAVASGQECNEQKDFTSKDIVLTKWIAMDGMLKIAEEKKEELKKHFAPDFIRQILSHRQSLFADREIEAVRNLRDTSLYQITEGGIFAELFKIAEELKIGLEIDMKKISVLQETIEVCEYFRLNPYQMTSVGSFLVITDDGEKLVEVLAGYGVEASLIGRTTDNHDKIIKNGEDVRYIDRPAPDEIYKIFLED